MVASDPESSPVRQKEHRVDNIARKAEHLPHLLPTESNKGPAGGFDDTPVPRAPPGYTVKITFHSAHNLPFADFNTFSSDPYVLAQINTKLPSRHKQDPRLRFRTPTIRRNTEPVWNCEWIVANIPSSGFELKCRVYDEDPADHDDRLGTVHVQIPMMGEDWEGIKEKSFTVHKRRASKRAYLFRGAAVLLNPEIHMNAELILSIEVLGRTDTDNGGRVYTVGPCHWSRHFSPLIGMLVGTKDPSEMGADGKMKRQRYNFQANQIQLQGPTPDAMYHRYVEFKPFVKGMFTATSARGFILNRAMHHQHARIYNYDRTTVYGSIPGPSEELTRQFLELAHWDKGGRIFTYVITLDGQMRFTETGKEFGIDMLSKHTMHADCDNWISFSGEFFIRRMKHPWTGHRGARARSKSGLSATSRGSNGSGSGNDPEASPFASPLASPRPMSNLSLRPDSQSQQHHDFYNNHPLPDTPHSQSQFQRQPSPALSHDSQGPAEAIEQPLQHPPHDLPSGPPHSPPPPDPRYYHLIIDNDSGTYRPNVALLPTLRRFLRSQFPGLRISTLDSQGDAERMARLKEEQRERRRREKGTRAFVQPDSSDDEDGSSSSSGWSSSDEEELKRVLKRQDTRGSTKSLVASPIEKGKEMWKKLREKGSDRPNTADGFGDNENGEEGGRGTNGAAGPREAKPPLPARPSSKSPADHPATPNGIAATPEQAAQAHPGTPLNPTGEAPISPLPSPPQLDDQFALDTTTTAGAAGATTPTISVNNATPTTTNTSPDTSHQQTQSATTQPPSTRASAPTILPPPASKLKSKLKAFSSSYSDSNASSNAGSNAGSRPQSPINSTESPSKLPQDHPLLSPASKEEAARRASLGTQVVGGGGGLARERVTDSERVIGLGNGAVGGGGLGELDGWGRRRRMSNGRDNGDGDAREINGWGRKSFGGDGEERGKSSDRTRDDRERGSRHRSASKGKSMGVGVLAAGTVGAAVGGGEAALVPEDGRLLSELDRVHEEMPRPVTRVSGLSAVSIGVSVSGDGA